MENKKDIIIDTFSLIFDAIIKSEEEKYVDIIQKLNDLYKENENLYDVKIALLFANLTEFVSKPFREQNSIQDKEHSFIIPYLYNGVFEHFVRTTIEKQEGSPFSGDKVNFVIKNIKTSLLKNENILFHTEEQVNKPEEYWWIPSSFSDTYDVIHKFKKWYFM